MKSSVNKFTNTKLISFLFISFFPLFCPNNSLNAQTRNSSQTNSNNNVFAYYGKKLNSLLKPLISHSLIIQYQKEQEKLLKNSLAFKFQKDKKAAKINNFNLKINVDLEELRELYRVLSLNHIEKADQGFDAIVESCNVNSDINHNCYKQSKNEYTYSRGIVYNDLDKQISNSGVGAPFVVDVYCNQIFKFSGPSNFRSLFASSKENLSGLQNHSLIEVIQPMGDINIEHTWPQSKFSKQFPGDLQKGDLHHLYPSNAKANAVRGNHPFGEVETEENHVTNCDSKFGLNSNGDEVYEPVKGHRGNVARSLFYFSIRYKIAIDPTQEAILRKWHEADPVDEVEQTRNNKIFAIQKNRNPFVDFPALVSVITDY